jgi:hypothetical protein
VCVADADSHSDSVAIGHTDDNSDCDSNSYGNTFGHDNTNIYANP